MELIHTRGQATDPSNSLPQVLRRHPLLFYFLLAYALTWAYELFVFGVLPLSPTWLSTGLPTLGPPLAAFLLMAVTQGRVGMLQLLRRYVLWRVGIPWYLLVLLGVPALLLLPFLILPGALSAFHLPELSLWPAYLLLSLLVLVAGGPLGEEGGWRGFALPRLQQRFGPLGGTLLLGVLWGLWHLPLALFIPGWHGDGGNGTLASFVSILGPFFVFVISTIAITVIMTWVFNNTRGSLLLAILLHASINATFTVMVSMLFPSLPFTILIGMSMYGVLVVMAVLVIVATRGRLSYRRYQRETALPVPVLDQEQEKAEARASV